MLCGNFSHVDDEQPWSTATPRKSRRRDSKNPYSKRGLDKFSNVLAELESRRENIMAQMGSQDIFLVRFVYKNSNDWVPIVVKIRGPKETKTEKSGIIDDKNKPSDQNSRAIDQHPTRSSAGKEIVLRKLDGRVKKFSLGVKERGVVLLRQRSNHFVVTMILILLCVVIFGRVFAIFCTSIWWYMAPTLKSGNLNGKRTMKKESDRELIEKKLHVELRSVQSKKIGAMENQSPRHHLNGKK
ncbi:uncharacterized protein LOC143875741 [Tasmannia lanceolata]|uniref:uncharacterized protein LOC143875741 n=1 Tax=Tasmannia lanceolata TaxID=3420 RepID=UPI004063BBCD